MNSIVEINKENCHEMPVKVLKNQNDIFVKDKNLLQTIQLVNNKKNTLLNVNYIVTHNLRNQIGNISSLVQMKDSGIIDNDEFFIYITSISKELNSTISDLSDLVSKKNNDSIKKSEINLSDYVKKALNVFLTDIDSNKIKVINSIPTDFSIQFNTTYLESVLLNLTSNAIKYSTKSKLSFIDYSVAIDGDYKVLTVKDNGIGIDLEKYKEEIFDAYKTFNTNTSNSIGIGLYVIKNQILEMGGKIEVESKINEGTTFKIFFN